MRETAAELASLTLAAHQSLQRTCPRDTLCRLPRLSLVLPHVGELAVAATGSTLPTKSVEGAGEHDVLVDDWE